METIQQLSIFLENKSGKLYEIMEIIAKANISILAATVADTSEYGILRLITTDNTAAFNILRDKSIASNINEVIAFATEPKAGSFFEKLKQLSTAQISIEYMYCFSIGDRAFVILKVQDTQRTLGVMELNGFETCSVETLMAT